MARISFMMEKTPIPPPPPITTNTFLLHASGSSDPTGVLLEVPGSQVSFTDQGLSYIFKSAMLSDGRVVFPCYDDDGPVVVKCYEYGSLSVESWSTPIPGSAYGYYSDITILNNGNIVIAWGDYDNSNLSFAILDTDGGIVQGMTNAQGVINSMDYDYDSWVIPLVDGGFCFYWRDGGTSSYYLSLWNANGTLRQARTSTDGVNASPQVQMPIGAGTEDASELIGVFDGNTSYSFWHSKTNLNDDYTYEDIGISDNIIHTGKLPSWTDKILIASGDGGSISGSIMDSDFNLLIDNKVMLSGTYTLNSVLSLGDDTFLIQATTGADFGVNYWIFDANLDLVSGPTAAFTGITSNNIENVKGSYIDL